MGASSQAIVVEAILPLTILLVEPTHQAVVISIELIPLSSTKGSDAEDHAPVAERLVRKRKAVVPSEASSNTRA